jgi:hypothetical protein
VPGDVDVQGADGEHRRPRPQAAAHLDTVDVGQAEVDVGQAEVDERAAGRL